MQGSHVHLDVTKLCDEVILCSPKRFRRWLSRAAGDIVAPASGSSSFIAKFYIPNIQKCMNADNVHQRRRQTALDHGEELCQLSRHATRQIGESEEQGGDPRALRQVLARRRNKW